MQQFNANGAPLNGCKLYIYSAGTSTPVTIYQDYALSIEHTFPVVADSTGRIPAFWLADGTYRARLLDADGNEIFDEDNITAIGPSSGTGGGGTTTPTAAIFQTGDFLWLPVAGARTGWVRANARTIGSAASGASERANADVEDLFSYLWTNFTNALCPVTGGRGASAAADWAANKVIATLDMRGYGAFGLDDMANTAAGVITGSTAAAIAFGAQSATIAQANLPNVTLSGTGSGVSDSKGGHSHFIANTDSQAGSVALSSSNYIIYDRGSGGNTYTLLGSNTIPSIGLSSSVEAHTHSVTISTIGVPLGGSGTALTILPPGRPGTWYVRL